MRPDGAIRVRPVIRFRADHAGQVLSVVQLEQAENLGGTRRSFVPRCLRPTQAVALQLDSFYRFPQVQRSRAAPAARGALNGPVVSGSERFQALADGFRIAGREGQFVLYPRELGRAPARQGAAGKKRKTMKRRALHSVKHIDGALWRRVGIKIRDQ